MLAPKTGWRHAVPRLRTTLWVLFGLFVAGFLGLVILYNAVKIPQPNAAALANSTIIYYSDGKTELARVGEENRVIVPFSAIPKHVRDAVLAAEDRNFYNEPGVSTTGMLRAVKSMVLGGSLQGGSTITQQYVKNAYLTPARTPTRKLKEIVIATKLDRTTSKNEILGDYLNTIWFGRGASGIQAAAGAYFGTTVDKLTVAQGAVLAATIQSPALLDPYLHHDAAVARWHYVVDGMVKDNALTQAQADKLAYPKVGPPRPVGTSSGPTRFIQNAVLDALAALDAQNVAGLTDKDIQTGGLRVVTTIDVAAQKSAVDAEATVFQAAIKSAKKKPVSALVSIEPGTGKIKAMYGGATFAGTNGCDSATANCTNLATQIKRPPGSTFKAFVLSTALSQGTITLATPFNGPSQSALKDGTPVHNDAEGETCSSCTLVTAIARSINTIFEPLAETIGPKAVADQAHALGIPADDNLSQGGFTGPSIALGTYDVRPIDMAAAYATFAANGTRATPYLVESVKDAAGAVTYKAKVDATPNSLDPEVAASVNLALQAVMTDPQATGRAATLDGGRPVAGKTGTTGESKDAWFVGYTPQLATAVWIGNVDNTTTINQIPGYAPGLYGGGLPAKTFKAFMDGALKGQPVKQFPAPTKPLPSPSPSPSSSLSTSASVSPTPTPTVTPSVTPSNSATDVPSGSPSPGTSSPSVTSSPSGPPSGSPPASPGAATPNATG
ncbi:MAG: hypothetical protein QOC60_474 [Frankiaceae bacterium]|nr:hypothetical protein [Frankiaceae bacterium]